jgi:hypothetical protein
MDIFHCLEEFEKECFEKYMFLTLGTGIKRSYPADPTRNSMS